MNVPYLTQAADGVPRRRFTNGDIQRMIESGIIDSDEHFELIHGEIVPMAAEHNRHLRARARLIRTFNLALGEEWVVITEGSLFLAEDIEFRPDLHIFPMAMRSEDVRGPDVLLAVELSSTTQKKDLELKAPIYAALGVRELWVIDLDARSGFVFDRIEDGAYAPGRSVSANDKITPLAFPSVSLRISDLC